MRLSPADFRPLDPSERAACAEMIRAGSKSFHAASRLLPPRSRDAARALYAFCRTSDDLVDDAARGGAVADLRGRLDRIYAGAAPPALADRAFLSAVAAYRIPRAIPDALIEGFAWDEANRRYETLDDLLGYAARVAGTVGVMTLAMGRRRRATLARAADLGLAMQLTNIARDVGEDARRGRVYLPLDWLAAEGVGAEALLAAPRDTPALRRVVARTLEAADGFYRRGLNGLGALPLFCRPAIGSAALIYRDIGAAIALNGFNSVDLRAHTGGYRKLALIGRATAGAAMGAASPDLPAELDAPPHPATAFLVEAVPPEATDDSRAARFLELLHAPARRRVGDDAGAALYGGA